jgi:hypothetical protein
VIDDHDKEEERKKLLAYIATLPEKQRAVAFEKLFGKKPPLAGLGLAPTGVFGTIAQKLTTPRGLLVAAALGVGAWMFLRRKK